MGKYIISFCIAISFQLMTVETSFSYIFDYTYPPGYEVNANKAAEGLIHRFPGEDWSAEYGITQEWEQDFSFIVLPEPGESSVGMAEVTIPAFANLYFQYETYYCLGQFDAIISPQLSIINTTTNEIFGEQKEYNFDGLSAHEDFSDLYNYSLPVEINTVYKGFGRVELSYDINKFIDGLTITNEDEIPSAVFALLGSQELDLEEAAVKAVAEPATFLLFGVGLAGIAAFSRKKSKM